MFGGMDMMLKSFGIDPDALQNTAKEMAEMVKSIQDDQKLILKNQHAIMEKLGIAETATPKIED